MGRKIKAIDASTGQPIEVDEDQIKSGPIRNPSLSEPLLARVRNVHARLKHAYNVTLEQFEIGFMREGDPERELITWEVIAAGFEKVTAKYPDVDEKKILRTLLGYSMDALTPGERADPVVKKIIEFVEGE